MHCRARQLGQPLRAHQAGLYNTYLYGLSIFCCDLEVVSGRNTARPFLLYRLLIRKGQAPKVHIDGPIPRPGKKTRRMVSSIIVAWLAGLICTAQAGCESIKPLKKPVSPPSLDSGAPVACACSMRCPSHQSLIGTVTHRITLHCM